MSVLGGLKSTCKSLLWERGSGRAWHWDLTSDLCCHPIRAKPELLIISQYQVGNFPVDDVVLRNLTDIATTKRCFSYLAVKRKNPLITLSVFGVTDETMISIARNYRRITA